MDRFKGQNGYINRMKKKHLSYGFVFLLIVLGVYFIGVIIDTDFSIYFTVAAAILVLPTAQNFTRFLLFYKYISIEVATYQQFIDISSQLVVLSDLLIVHDKKTYFIPLVAVTDKEIIILYNVKKKEKKLIVQKAIENLILVKGYRISTLIFNDSDEMYTYIKQNIKGKLEDINQEKQEKISGILLQNSI